MSPDLSNAARVPYAHLFRFMAAMFGPARSVSIMFAAGDFPRPCGPQHRGYDPRSQR